MDAKMEQCIMRVKKALDQNYIALSLVYMRQFLDLILDMDEHALDAFADHYGPDTLPILDTAALGLNHRLAQRLYAKCNQCKKTQ